MQRHAALLSLPHSLCSKAAALRGFPNMVGILYHVLLTEYS